MESRAKSVMFLGREIHNFDTHTWQRTTDKLQKKQHRFAQLCRAEWIKFEEKKLKINGLTKINQANTSQEKSDSPVSDINTYRKIC